MKLAALLIAGAMLAAAQTPIAKGTTPGNGSGSGGGSTTVTLSIPYITTRCMLSDGGPDYTSRGLVSIPNTATTNSATVNACSGVGVDNYLNFPTGVSSWYWIETTLPSNWDGGIISTTVNFFFFGSSGTATLKAATYCPIAASLAQTVSEPPTNAVTSVALAQGSIVSVEVTKATFTNLAKTGAGNACAAGKPLYIRIGRDSDAYGSGLAPMGGTIIYTVNLN